MNAYILIVLRLLHIFCSALWVSVAFLFRFFVNPALNAIGPDSQKFGQALNDRNRFSIFMGAITLLTLISGFILYYKASGGLNFAWIMTGPGIGFSIGAVAGIIAFFIGGFAMEKITIKLRAAMEEESKTEKNQNQGTESKVANLQKSLNKIETLDFIFLSMAMAAMATARYW